MATPTILMGITAGAEAGGAILGGESKKSAIDLEAQKNQLNIQQQKTQEAKALNKSVSHNMVSASASGVSLGSPSLLAMTGQDFHNYADDKQVYDMDSQMASLMAQAQKSSITAGEFTSVAGAAGEFAGMAAGGAGASAGAGMTPTTISQAPSVGSAGGYLSSYNYVSSNVFEFAKSHYNPYDYF